MRPSVPLSLSLLLLLVFSALAKMFCGSHCPPQNSEEGLHEKLSGQDISALHLRCQLHTQASNHNGIFTIFCSYSADPKLSHCSPSLSQAACARFKFPMNKASPYTSRICFQRNKVPDLVSEGHRHSVTIFLGNCFDVPGKWRPRRPST